MQVHSGLSGKRFEAREVIERYAERLGDGSRSRQRRIDAASLDPGDVALVGPTDSDAELFLGQAAGSSESADVAAKGAGGAFLNHVAISTTAWAQEQAAFITTRNPVACCDLSYRGCMGKRRRSQGHMRDRAPTRGRRARLALPLPRSRRGLTLKRGSATF
jgi:hypothetical protein